MTSIKATISSIKLLRDENLRVDKLRYGRLGQLSVIRIDLNRSNPVKGTGTLEVDGKPEVKTASVELKGIHPLKNDAVNHAKKKQRADVLAVLKCS